MSHVPFPLRVWSIKGHRIIRFQAYTDALGHPKFVSMFAHYVIHVGESVDNVCSY